MKYRLVGLAIAFLIIATLACGGGDETPTQAPAPTPAPAPTQPPPTQPPSAETATLILQNDSAETICFVLISLAENEDWGEDWLDDTEVIAPGDSYTFDVPAGTYDLEARDCDSNVLATEWETDLDGATTWTISGDAPATGDATLDFNEPPNFGEETLKSGFQPDPYTAEVLSGGDVEVAALGLGSECGGYASVAPDFRISLTNSIGQLRFFFVAAGDEDATLIISAPSGNWLCNDDFSDWNPMIEFQNAESGQYDIWIGSYSADEYIEGVLYVTELDLGPGDFATEIPFDDESGLDMALEPNFGTQALEPGFQPDPHTVSVLSGGTVDVATLGLDFTCGGYASNAPDYRINLEGDSAELRIFFVSDEGEDATLIVNDPYANWFCNDDFSGWDPMVAIENAASGQYDIWVGSYAADEYIAGTLYVTELDYDPGNLP